MGKERLSQGDPCSCSCVRQGHTHWHDCLLDAEAERTYTQDASHARTRQHDRRRGEADASASHGSLAFLKNKNKKTSPRRLRAGTTHLAASAFTSASSPSPLPCLRRGKCSAQPYRRLRAWPPSFPTFALADPPRLRSSASPPVDVDVDGDAMLLPPP